jgi:DNA invertase Pin-like site-specific DNA recombinase
VASERQQLDAALDYLRSGDVLVVTKLDRLARSVADLCKILGDLEARGASLRVQNMGLDTASPTGKLVLNVLGSIAQFERELMLERQREASPRPRLRANTRAGSQRHEPRAMRLSGYGQRVSEPQLLPSS